MRKDTVLRMENITKVYPNGIVANKDVNFSVRTGEIHGLVGENGAGKTTLMQILFGLNQADAGKILFKDKEIKIDNPHTAISHGIGMVHQHFMLVSSLTVSENLVLGLEPRRGLIFDKPRGIRITRELSNKYNLKVEPSAIVRDLPVGLKQKVEILKALHRGAKILILDEPTAVLTPQEMVELFDELRQLRDGGNTIIFISHKLAEIKALCDRVTVMRGGENRGIFNVEDVSEQDISRIMVGRDVILQVDKDAAKPKESVLEVSNLTVLSSFNRKYLDNVSFSLRSGEILGVAGVEGNGQRELVEVITGFRSYGRGRILIGGKDIKQLSIKEIRDLECSHIPEDRMSYGCAPALSVRMNLISYKHSNREFNRRIALMNMDAVREFSTKLVREYRILCTSPDQEVGRMSGGNIQKVIVAREFSDSPKLIVANQPTRGIDVGATEFIRKRLVELRDGGAAVLLVSADLNEVMELSDSFLVMYEGKINAFIENVFEFDEEELGQYMLGIKIQDAAEIRKALRD